MDDSTLARWVNRHMSAAHTLSVAPGERIATPTMWLLPASAAMSHIAHHRELIERLDATPSPHATRAGLAVITSEGPAPATANVAVVADTLTLGPWVAPPSWREYASLTGHVLLVVDPRPLPSDPTEWVTLMEALTGEPVTSPAVLARIHDR